MLLVGSDDGVFRLESLDNSATAASVLEAERVQRLRQFDGLPGVFAATKDGLYHSPDGETWTDLGVPEELVYTVGAHPDGDRLYAGTRPAHVFEAPVSGANDLATDLDWNRNERFAALPSREEWRLPRHDNLAQVRDLHFDPAGAERLVAGIEVGGVYVSEDAGETWTDRSAGMDDDVHELHVVGPATYLAATGFGCFLTQDAGKSWTRLDEGFDQRYFRSTSSVGDDVYASGALANSSTWNDPDADPELFVLDGEGGLTRQPIPAADETVTGITAVDGDPVVGTHRGSVFVRRGDSWAGGGSFPVSEAHTGRYTPLAWLEE
ncbi:WD40/YVTN/BNR-like repeat-containing protein [Halobacteriales archaeon Cl-PHB]